MARIRLYQNTGFNAVDIPESIALVKQRCDLYEDYDDSNVIQAQGLTDITVNSIEPVDAACIDLALIQDDSGLEILYYVDSDYTFVAPRTCNFKIYVMATSTILDSLTVISASANRMHVTEDDDNNLFFGNDEPFTPALNYVTGTAAMDPRFPDTTGNPVCTNILETVVAPPRFRELPDQTAIDGGGGVASVTGGFGYSGGGSGGGTRGPEYDFTTNALITMQESESDPPFQSSLLFTTQPKFRAKSPTAYTMGKLFQGDVSISTGSCWWCSGADQVVNELTAIGANSGVTNYWAVPTVYLGSISDSGYNKEAESRGGISSISSNTYVNTAPLNAETIGVFKNNKMYYGQALTITVYNPVSGSSNLKQVHQIRDVNSKPNEIIYGTYSIAADVRPDGAPVFAWKNRDGKELTGFPEIIEGGSWRKIPISADTYSGSYWDRRNLEMQKKISLYGNEEAYSTVRNAGLNESAISTSIGAGIIGAKFGGGAGSAFGPVGAGIGSGAGFLVSAGTSLLSQLWPASAKTGIGYSEMQRILDLQAFELNQRAGVPTPGLTISTSNYLREIGFNSFFWIVSSYSAQDLIDFDTFLTKYGYNVGSRGITKNDFFSRPYFNYIRLNNITMKSDEYNITLRAQCENELKRGVRIWHTLPNRAAIVNGNKTVTTVNGNE